MTTSSISDSANAAVALTKQLFRFLKAFAERNAPVTRRIADHHWSLWLRELPQHPCIAIGSVQLSPSATETSLGPAAQDEALITVRRPDITKAPTPPDAILDFLKAGWREPDGSIAVDETRNITRNGETITERFDEDAKRVKALRIWQAQWNEWAYVERPARQAMRIFERLYELKGRIDRESERYELVLGDGRLIWSTTSGSIDHPVILQRVEVVFDADIPALRVLDTDREAELFSAVLSAGEALSPTQLTELREQVRVGGYHPLEQEGTTQYLRRLVQLLAPNGMFGTAETVPAATKQPVILRDPVLFLRDRPSGFPAAFDRVLADLERRAEVPVALTRLVGVDQPIADQPQLGQWSPWGEPPEILLSKPANEEQIHVARALERHGAIVVQGPPGTGKSHTIANLIGHLVAHGKRVLVTSHSTKALKVLRGSIVETLRPLCVALLDNDLDGRVQMEQAVKAILTRLTTANQTTLEKEVADLSEARAALNSEIARCAKDLKLIRESEYKPILIAGESVGASEAARWTTQHQDGSDWIPNSIEAGAPLPLTREEVLELYASNAELNPSEEQGIAAGVPTLDSLETPQAFVEMVGALAATEPADYSLCWQHAAQETDSNGLRRFGELVRDTNEELTHIEPWQLTIVGAGYGGGSNADLWRDLDRRVRAAEVLVEKSLAHFIQYSPELASDVATDEAVILARTLERHVERHGSLGLFSRWLNGSWRRFLRSSRCNGREPKTLDEIRAVRMAAELEQSRQDLRVRWTRLAEPSGLPPHDDFGDVPEPRLSAYTRQVERLLAWWDERWHRISQVAEDVGFRWEIWRDREAARSSPADPFAFECGILRSSLPKVIAARVSVTAREVAERRLNQCEKALAEYDAPQCATLRAAIAGRDVGAYEAAYSVLKTLIRKRGCYVRRHALLGSIAPVAPEWARAIRNRAGDHGAARPPGDPVVAWRWRQLRQEVDRRAALDEAALMRSMHAHSAQLRETTADLIDRRAWLGQIRRVDLRASQALQGWSLTQKKIGKGTGKRAPALQAEARKLLADARDAVPVWIMPLSRVAESFDAAKAKFDVVIIDEASQSDVTGLLAWYLGDRVAVVGDHEQVSPLAVGQRLDVDANLIAQYLAKIPNAQLFDGKMSIYDLARTCFGGTIALREHFRCVTEIIDFSNYLSYDGQILPLRDSTRVVRSHVIEHVVTSTRVSNRGNLAEARAVVAIMKALCEMPENADRTMGAISLVGDEQATLIQEIALQVLGAVELDHHKFAAGNAAQFQGDERDIMFLSMVDVPEEHVLSLRQTDVFKQRFNVAASRAKDHMWLIHSLNPDRDLNAVDLRRRLIEHVRDPGARRNAIQQAQKRAESPFESTMIERLISAGYQVRSQVWVGAYRIDMVVSDPNGQVALECDGDRFHGVDQIPADMARQAVLERAGWRFIRVRGTRFYRDPESTMGWVFSELDRCGVRPALGVGRAREDADAVREFRDAVMRRAWQVMREQGWMVAAKAPLDGSLSASDDVRLAAH